MTVEELLKAKAISFLPRGKDFVIRCLSPSHEDRNPSLRVDKTTGVFNCLSCGYSGNLFFHFGEKVNNLDLRREKLRSLISDKLVETSGYSIPSDAVPFNTNWRGISGETFSRFEAFQHHNSEFIGRVVIPIRGISGKIVSFCGRHQGDAQPKYLFHPAGSKLPLFPIVKPINGRIIIVEGIMDMINLHDKGLTNAVCAFGVNKVNLEKLNILKIQGVTGIDIFYDMDDAGHEGAEKLKEFLDTNDMPNKRILYSNIKDPGELTASKVIKIKETLYGG
jgi:DNA primase